MAAVPSIGRASRVEGASAPEADVTRALYEQYANQIFRYCLHQLGSREEAEDAVQSTFLNAFRGIKRGIVPEVESAWLFKIAHNVCLSRRRSTWRRGRIESPTDFEVVEELAPAPSRRSDELIGLQDVLEQMPEQQRRAILLREWQGLSYREIAAELELSQAAVETLIFRARRTLAQGLEQPVEVRERRRVSRRAAGALGNLLSSAQSFLLGGGAAVKVAATVAVVSAGTVVATAPVQKHAPRNHTTPAPAVAPAQAPARQSGTSGVAVAPPVSAGGVQRVIARTRAKHAVHVPAATPTPLVTPSPAPAPEAPAPAPQAAPPATSPAPVAAAEPAAPAPAAPAVPAAPASQQPSVSTPPGQAKKKDDPPAAATPTPGSSQPALPPGQARKSEIAPSLPPGQAKKADDPPAVAPAPAPEPSLPPGQAKKIDDLVPPAQQPTPAGVAVQMPPAAPGAFLPPSQGNGNDNGKGHGKDK